MRRTWLDNSKFFIAVTTEKGGHMIIDTERLNRTQLAHVLGVGGSTIGRWRHEGMPRDESTKTYKLRTVIGWRFQRMQADRPTSEKLDKETLRYRKAKATKAELEAGLLEGTLVYREATTRAFRGMILAAKSKLLSVPSQIGNQLSGTVEHEIIAIITDTAQRIINQALTELAATKEAEGE